MFWLVTIWILQRLVGQLIITLKTHLFNLGTVNACNVTIFRGLSVDKYKTFVASFTELNCDGYLALSIYVKLRSVLVLKVYSQRVSRNCTMNCPSHSVLFLGVNKISGINVLKMSSCKFYDLIWKGHYCLFLCTLVCTVLSLWLLNKEQVFFFSKRECLKQLHSYLSDSLDQKLRECQYCDSLPTRL